MTETKECSGKKNIIMFYGFVQLGSSLISAIALSAIAFWFCSIKNESKTFNNCVNEIVNEGKSNSEAVRYCKGG